MDLPADHRGLHDGPLPRFLVRDRDCICGDVFRRTVKVFGVEEMVAGPKMPMQEPTSSVSSDRSVASAPTTSSRWVSVTCHEDAPGHARRDGFLHHRGVDAPTNPAIDSGEIFVSSAGSTSCC
ncbi:MAG: hypothetical protein CMJ83_14670 [Planctomycetes bacterium]|nr:hypothetical protein [Planctomycetota bacterium]